MHVSKQRTSRSRLLAWCTAVVILCAQASAFFSCSFGGSSSDLFPPPPPPNASVSIRVTPTSIALGQSAVLSWSSSGVTACTASGAWSGPQNPQGSARVTPSTPGTFGYVLNCSTGSGSVAQSATLTVTAMGGTGGARHFVAMRAAMRLRRTDLVASVAGTRALHADADLGEPWGLVLAPGIGAVVASRETNTSTAYDGAGSVQPPTSPLRLRLSTGNSAVLFGATAVVANDGDDFIVTARGNSAPARLLYTGTGGWIAAFSPGIDPGPLLVYAARDSATYTGLAIATSSTPGASRLYAADFRNGRIDVFDAAFRKQSATATQFAFADATLPAGYAPFGIAAIDGLLYVACAQRALSGTADPAMGPGLGLIDVFTAEGDFIRRLVTTGSALNAPWAMVTAPQAGGLRYARALLVGNTGDGTISAFDMEEGVLLGSFGDERGGVLLIPHLHGLAFGDGHVGLPQTTLFFSAGADDAAGGWYGRLDFLDR